MNNLEDRKKELIYELINNNYKYVDIIMELINNNSINHLIKKITNKKTITNHNKTIINANEQFLRLLENFIYRLRKDFYFLNNLDSHLFEILLNNNKYSNYLLCKKYLGNNDYIQFFQCNYMSLVIHGFVQNYNDLAPLSDIINKLLKDNKITLTTNLDLPYHEIEKIYKLLQKLSICNATFFNVSLLFESVDQYIDETIIEHKPKDIKNTTKLFYLFQWELMIKEYYNKIDVIDIILK